MRLNAFLAQATNLSRRAADTAIRAGRVVVNGQPATLGRQITDTDAVTLDNKPVRIHHKTQTIMLHKPVGYVCSRNGQGSKTIYDLLPQELQHLKPIGRLDKDTSGLLLLTNDGQLTQQLTHPSFEKEKIYEITLDNELMPKDVERITRTGVKLDDGLSKLGLDYIEDDTFKWCVHMHEGRNRQIRRTFAALGYKVLDLHRVQFGPYKLGSLPAGKTKELDTRQ